MTRFYFHMRMGDHIELDTDGTELPSFAAAQDEALQSAREILADAIKGSSDPIDGFVIADENGQELASIPLRDALPKDIC